NANISSSRKNEKRKSWKIRQRQKQVRPSNLNDKNVLNLRKGDYAMKRQQALLSAIVFLLMPAVAGAQNRPLAADQKGHSIQVFESSEDKHESLAEKPVLAFRTERAPALTIFVNDATKYQEIDGFGASLTESSAYLLKRKLSDAQRGDALRMLFDRQKGIGLSMLRQPMSASDFALGIYSYDEMPDAESHPNLNK